ncbi:MAG: hypothetical protein WCL16_06285 [bacterium]
MSLHVDLMLPDERRDVTPMRPKALLQILLGTLILFALLGAVKALHGYNLLTIERKDAKERWAKMELRQKTAARMGKDLAACREIYGELQGWQGTRLPVTEWMARLAALCPSTIQLNTLHLTGVTALGGPRKSPCRQFELRLTGRTDGTQADQNVCSLQAIFTNQPPFSNAVESVTVPEGAFRQDPDAAATKDDRVFELVIRCTPRVFP